MNLILLKEHIKIATSKTSKNANSFCEQVEKIATTEFEDLSEQFAGLMLPETHPYYARMTRVASRILRANSDMVTFNFAFQYWDN